MKSKTNATSFMITIKGTQNETWQGTIERVEEQRKESFRSALELLKLIDSAVDNEKDK